MGYSFNRDTDGIVFATLNSVNVSSRDLCAVCDAVRYKSVEQAMHLLEEAGKGKRAIQFRRHASGMGARHELGGKRGRYPKKCASFVQKALRNAMANAINKGYLPELMYIVHASSNRTFRAMRLPSKGAMYVRGSHGIGGVSHRRSDLELAKIEIGISNGSEKGLSKRMIAAIAAESRRQRMTDRQKQLKQQVQQQIDAAKKAAVVAGKQTTKPTVQESAKLPEPQHKQHAAVVKPEAADKQHTNKEAAHKTSESSKTDKSEQQDKTQNAGN